MINESKALTDVWKWKDEIYEETKGRSIKEIIEKSKNEAEELIKEYGIKLPKLEKSSYFIETKG